MTMNFREHFERDPNICAGQTVFRGTRVILRTILASIADGDTDEEILRNFPALTPEDLRAAIAQRAWAESQEGVASMLRHFWLSVARTPRLQRRTI